MTAQYLTTGITTTTVMWSPSVDDDDEIDHLFCCCSPMVGLCGADLSDCEEVEDEDEDFFPCVVCLDLQDRLCVRCGFAASGPCWCGTCS